jgi:Flp pilus assembly protein TadG
MLHFPLRTPFDFLRDCRGNIAVFFARMLVPLTLAAGVGVDYAQALNFKNSLQGAVDAAALASASVYTGNSGTSGTAQQIATDYMNNAIKTLPPNKGVTFTVTPATSSSGGNTTAYTVAITATASVTNAFMALASINTTNVSVSATAENPVTTVTVGTNGFSSSACDANTVYWYPIPSGSNASTYVPPHSALTQL